MAIIRGGIAADHFTIVPNAWLRDPRLSYKAKGLLAYVASHAVGYVLTVKQMIAQSRDGRDSVYAAIRELIDAGYLVRTQSRDDNGKVTEVDYQVVDPSNRGDTNSGGTAGHTASGKAESGKAGSGSEQGKQRIFQGHTASGKTGSGRAVSGKPDTKKTKVLEDDLLEDPENPNPGTVSAALSDPSGPASIRGHVSSSQNPTDTLAAEALVFAPHWSASVLASVLTDPKIQARPWDVVTRAVLSLARGNFGETISPRRLLIPGPWWPAAGGDSRGAALPPAVDATRCPKPGHVGQLLVSCAVCRSEALGGAA